MTPGFRNLGLLIFAATAATACMGQTAQRPARLDPSNPNAPESAAIPPSNALVVEGDFEKEAPGGENHQGLAMPSNPQSADEHAGHSSKPQDAAPHASETKGSAQPVYTCPMHPEVQQPVPGKCPKCGMTLVPRDSSPAVDGPPPAILPKNRATNKEPTKSSTATYTCSMHPEVVRSKPGRCPKCGMKLVPTKAEPGGKPDAGVEDHQPHEGTEGIRR